MPARRSRAAAAPRPITVRPLAPLVLALVVTLALAVTTPARAAESPIDVRWQQLGGEAGVLGAATGSEHDVAGVPGARAREFEHGDIYFSAATGAWDVQEPVLTRLLALGGVAGTLGLPSAAAGPTTGEGASRQPFQRGEVFASEATGVRALTGAVLAAYAARGGPDGALGLPTSEQATIGGGTQTVFQNGRIYWSSATEAQTMVAGPVLSRYLQIGGPRSYLGFPRAGLTRTSTGKRQLFRHGRIVYTSASQATRVIGDWRAPQARVSASEIPYTYRPGCPVGPSSLRRVRMGYYDWAGVPQLGDLIVRRSAVSDLRKVFKKAFAARFPIRRMDPVDVWKGSDVRAMAADNTSAFNCRKVTGNPYRLSQHSYGNAIDINTRENPYVTSHHVYPSGAETFLKRHNVRKGMIVKRGPIARKMRRLGWPWGARWAHPDYQHFSSNGG